MVAPTQSDPAALLAVIVIVLALFCVGGGVTWLLDRAERRRDMAAGRLVLRLSRQLEREDDR